MTTPDSELVRLIQARDSAAFEELFARLADPLRRHLVSIVRDAAAAEDLLQEVFLRLWTHSDRWEGRGTLEAWLFGIATNLALNHVRSARRRKQQPLPVQPPTADDDDDSPLPGWMIDAAALGPDQIAAQAELRDRVNDLLDELPDDKRQLLRLAYANQMNLQDIADLLGVPKGTVKSRLHHARKNMAQKWEATQKGKL